VKESMWWIKEGYYSFKPGRDGYPYSGHVIQYYRERKIIDGRAMTQKDVAKILNIAERSVSALENDTVGLDSFNRRMQLVVALDIPPILLRLDHDYISDKGKQQSPGQVVKEYRKKRKKDDGSWWTQMDLAEVLGLSEKSVQSLESLDRGLDSISRRELLIRILDIPPTLLGLDACYFFGEKQSLEISKPRIPKQVTLDQKKIVKYTRLISMFWNNHYVNDTMESCEEAKKIIQILRSLHPYVNNDQQLQIRDLLCQYHQLVSNLARDQGYFEMSLEHAHFAVRLAERSENNELMAAALYRRGLTYFDQGNHIAAAQDLQNALPYADHARFQLKGMVYMEAGRFQSYVAQSAIEKVTAQKFLDQTEYLVRQKNLEDDAGYVKLDQGRYHIGRSATLIVQSYAKKAIEELDYADDLTAPDLVRRHAYIDILRARAYFDQKNYALATHIALNAASACLNINSVSNIADIARLHVSLKQTAFGSSPDVAKLGMIFYSK
jgi:transcriptional regulator with XRE-family HTH domain